MENALSEAVNTEGEKPAAPEAVETASTAEASVSEETKPEVTEKTAKTFSQEEVDALIGKRLAREERKWQRERDRAIAEAARASVPKQQEAKPANEPKPDDFKSTEDYVRALADHRAEEIVNKRLTERDAAEREARARRAMEESVSAYREREEEVREKYDDFDEVAYNPKLRVTDAMAETIQASESGPELAYHLGKNPKEAARIASLSPFLQAKELGRLEAKLADAPAAKKPSSAPDPIKPVGAKGGGNTTVDPTDPRSDKLSTDEWMRAEEKRLRKKMEAQGYR